MKLSQLIWSLLEQAQDLNPGVVTTDILSGEIGIDPEVRIAYQPNYPLAATLDTVTHIPPDAEPQSDEEAEDWVEHAADPTPDDPGILWIAAGWSPSDDPYAPREAWGE